MKVLYKIDTADDCPDCDSQLISFDGEHCVCPSCVVRELNKLRKENSNLKNRIKRLILQKALGVITEAGAQSK